MTYATVCVVAANVLTAPRARAERLDPRREVPGARAWSVRTEDGLTLRGWYLPTPEHHRLVIVLHGLWDCVDDVAGPAIALHRRGYDVLLFDFRGHGKSDAARLTLGRRERMDVRAALAWANAEGFPPSRIGWLAYSMGGSTLLMEAAENPDIQASVIDGAFGNLPAVLDRQLSRHSGLPAWFNPGILLAADLVFHAPSADLIPQRAALCWGNRPLLLLHGDADAIVPVAQGRSIAAAAGSSCEAVYLPHVGHGDGYAQDPQGYIQRIDDFFERTLDPS